MRYQTGQLEAIAQCLREMPPSQSVREHSKQDAVRLLADDIAALQARGYTLDQIAEKLSSEGLKIATPTLKNYLQRARVGPSKKAKPKMRPRSTSTTKAATLARPAAAGPATGKGTFIPKADTSDI